MATEINGIARKSVSIHVAVKSFPTCHTREAALLDPQYGTQAVGHFSGGDCPGLPE